MTERISEDRLKAYEASMENCSPTLVDNDVLETLFAAYRRMEELEAERLKQADALFGLGLGSALKQAEAECDRLAEELDTWKSAFPDITPERVAAHVETLRKVLAFALKAAKSQYEEHSSYWVIDGEPMPAKQIFDRIDIALATTPSEALDRLRDDIRREALEEASEWRAEAFRASIDIVCRYLDEREDWQARQIVSDIRNLVDPKQEQGG